MANELRNRTEDLLQRLRERKIQLDQFAKEYKDEDRHNNYLVTKAKSEQFRIFIREIENLLKD